MIYKQDLISRVDVIDLEVWRGNGHGLASGTSHCANLCGSLSVQTVFPYALHSNVSAHVVEKSARAFPSSQKRGRSTDVLKTLKGNGGTITEKVLPCDDHCLAAGQRGTTRAPIAASSQGKASQDLQYSLQRFLYLRKSQREFQKTFRSQGQRDLSDVR